MAGRTVVFLRSTPYPNQAEFGKRSTQPLRAEPPEPRARKKLSETSHILGVSKHAGKSRRIVKISDEFSEISNVRFLQLSFSCEIASTEIVDTAENELSEIANLTFSAIFTNR